MSIVPSRAPDATYAYNATVSAVSTATIAAWIDGLPERFRFGIGGTPTTEIVGANSGSVRVAFYIMTARDANALRKRFARKFKGRAKFARLVYRSGS
jgi:hypothetical protein